MMVVQHAKIYLFAKSCWNGIPNSYNDLINIKHVLRKILITKAPDGDL